MSPHQMETVIVVSASLGLRCGGNSDEVRRTRHQWGIGKRNCVATGTTESCRCNVSELWWDVIGSTLFPIRTILRRFDFCRFEPCFPTSRVTRLNERSFSRLRIIDFFYFLLLAVLVLRCWLSPKSYRIALHVCEVGEKRLSYKLGKWNPTSRTFLCDQP